MKWKFFFFYSSVQKQQTAKATNTDYMQSKMAQLKGLEQELQKKTMSVAEQIKQSEGNLLAHEKAINQQKQVNVWSWISIVPLSKDPFLP